METYLLDFVVHTCDLVSVFLLTKEVQALESLLLCAYEWIIFFFMNILYQKF